jgi:ubiquitin thioesterase protein OTUB1
MTMAGIDYSLVEEMFDETWTLFQEILSAFEQNHTSIDIVTRALNDENRSNAIVYHFKMMTSAYMALRAEDFQPFLEMSLDQYRQTRIDPTQQEIDQIGLQALTTGVIAPAGLAVEVLYLDRSAGDEVTPHEFVDNAASKPAIRLLYRP